MTKQGEHITSKELFKEVKGYGYFLLGFNATFNNISVVS